MHPAGMLSILLPAVALTAAVTGRTAGVGAFFALLRVPPVAMPRPPDSSPVVPLPGPPPPLEDTGDGNAIRSGGQLARPPFGGVFTGRGRPTLLLFVSLPQPKGIRISGNPSWTGSPRGWWSQIRISLIFCQASL